MFQLWRGNSVEIQVQFFNWAKLKKLTFNIHWEFLKNEVLQLITFNQFPLSKKQLYFIWPSINKRSVKRKDLIYECAISVKVLSRYEKHFCELIRSCFWTSPFWSAGNENSPCFEHLWKTGNFFPLMAVNDWAMGGKYLRGHKMWWTTFRF